MSNTDLASSQDASLIPPPVIAQSGPVPNIYAEGVTQFQLGYPISRLKLHSSSTRLGDDPNSQQIREICLDLTMPTVGLIEMCQKLLQLIGDNQELILKTKAEQESVFAAMLSGMSSPKAGSGV